MEATPPSKRNRKANWGEKETFRLAELYMDEVQTLKSSFKMPGVSNRKKHEIWEQIAEELNNSFNNYRTSAEVKKRWFFISSRSRQKIQRFREERNRTGGGPPPPPLDPIDELIEDILGPDSKTIMGEPQVDDLMDVLRADIKDVRPAAGGATADPLVSFNSHESADAPTVIYVDASAEEALPPSSTPSEDPTTGQMGAVRAVESAAQEHKAAAQAVASAARAQEAAARAQESAARAKESAARAKESTARAKESAARAKEAAMRAKEQAAKEKIEAMRLKAKYYKFKLENK
ncbi:uncharacterized protein LOC126984823 [Eriocheir sinensis]|uniref:uncharacterized protein LOC126984823 n=1 Tax=Eriocheir sinensis TaxID=95602 RepID=UPI0021C7E177|nr:uncharacterized protein LOC126984823 [Eriocheir sinensis]